MNSELQSTIIEPPTSPGSFVFPVTFAQQRLWFLDQLHPGDTSYLIPWNIRLTGELNVDALCAALNEIVARHETLRTTFALVDGEVSQVIAEQLAVPVPVVDLSGRTDAATEAERLAAEEAHQPIDLANGPLVRAQLLRISRTDHVFLLTLHHIIFDRWSRGILTRELAALYGAFLEGKPSPLGPLALQYADYAVWQRDYLQGEVLDAQLGYWKNQLAGAPAELGLPTDRPRPAVMTFRGAEKSFRFSESLARKLGEFAQGHGATLFMTLLAGFEALLSRYTGLDDVMVGTPIFNRNRTELESIIGFFANTLALRLDLSGDPSFAELVGRAKNVALGAYEHQDLPFDRIVQEVNPERSLSLNPLIQVLFSLGNVPRHAFELPGLDVHLGGKSDKTAKFDLSIILRPQGETLSGVIEYSTDLFDESTIVRMLGHFENLLTGAVENPERRLSELPLMGAEERKQVVFGFNDTAREYPRGECIHQLFSREALLAPDRTAVVQGKNSLSYGALIARANQLAHGLIRLGAGPDVLVGIRMSRGIDMLVGLLGILKAGSAYVPLDPSFPQERIEYILQDSAASIVVTDEMLSEAGWKQFADLPTGEPVTKVTPENLAYVLHTSGSTGRPKGVQITHRNLLNFLISMLREPGFSRNDVLLAVTTISFDIAGLELYLPLLAGGQLAIASRDEAIDGAQLAGLIQRYGITVLQATPATWRMLVQGGWKGTPRLKALCGGEAMPPELAEQLLPRVAELWNMYGPTETTVWSSVYRVRTVPTGAVPLGQPIANTTMYVVSAGLQPAPVGVPGELYIGGEGVARGYLNREDLTAERFLANPFVANTRIYKTGDIAKLLPSGDIQYLGRADFQVKVRGFRIELGEIETVLAQHAGVRECVVAAVDERLIGYVIPSGSGDPAAGELRAWAKERLPEYMVPAAFVELASFPLTPNGKVDRKALPAPSFSAADSDKQFVEARTPAEEIIAQIWAHVLRLDRVSVEDNFFELGGHSLLGMQAISRIREAFGVDLPLRAFFEAPTVAGLASQLALLDRVSTTLPLRRIEANGPLPVSFTQQRLWFLDQLHPGDASYLIPWRIRLTGSLDVQAFTQALNEIVQRHKVLRAKFFLVEGQVMQAIPDQPVAFPVPLVDLSAHPAAEAEALRLGDEEARQPFDLANGPVVRAQLLRLSASDHVLLLTFHHIVFDQWSSGVFLGELGELYRAFHEGRPSPLPELAIQFTDFAAWQREYLQGPVLDEHIAFWKAQLGGAPTELVLPTDRPRPAVLTFRGARKQFRFSESLSTEVTAFARQHGATVFMTLLAAFQALLSRYSGQEDIVVGTPISSRNRTELESIIGFFANTLVLREDLSGNPSFSELISRTRNVTLDAYRHQEMPFEKLVEELNPGRSLSHNPLVQVLFSFANVDRGAFELPGLEARFGGGTATSAKFDFSLIIRQQPGAISGVVEYSTDLFDESTIVRMVGHFENLLQGAVAEPERAVSQLPLLSGIETRQIVKEFNATDHAFARRSLHEFIEDQVARTPDAQALVFESERLTYRELNERANRLAHRLRGMGVGPGALVAVCAYRSVELVVALLGTMKAGGAYVPLDPDYPRERLSVMLADAEPRAVLLTERMLDVLPEHSWPTFCLDRDWHTLAAEPASNPPVITTPRDLAYVIYTSGSTGKPKGVPNVHEAIVNRLLWMQAAYPLDASDTVLQKTPYSFDVSVWEFFWPFMTGARMVVARPEGHKDPAYLVDLIAAHGVTTMHFVPSMLRVFLEARKVERCTSLRRVICSGEALPFDLQERFFERLSSELHNLYGPTEAAVDVTSFHCTPNSGRSNVPIGKPIWNTQIYILDTHGKPVPIGVAGELHIGGIGLATGYLKRPELTAERFVPDPFSPNPGARLYRTGDLARFLPDGNIEYLGRLDFQVKLRGLRIELGEIEAVIRQHRAVLDCVVIDREDVPGDKRLVAYIVFTQGELPADRELRELLLARLPEYMAPSAFVSLPVLPLTSSGKVDRKALPAPIYSREQGVEYVEPGSPLEVKLAAIWAAVLQLPRVGVNDDFFEIGGYSLLAVDLFSRIEKEIGQKLPLGLLFDARTIAAIAARMDQTEWQPAETSVKPLRTAGNKPPIYAAYGLGATVLTFRNLSRHLDPDQPIYCLEALGVDSGWNSLKELAAIYVRDMLAFQPQGPYHLMGASFGGMVVYEIARQLQAQGHEVGLVGLLDSYNRGDRNVQPRSERIDKQMGFIKRRVNTHLRRLLTRRPAQWPRYIVGRFLAIGRLTEGALWRVIYRTYRATPKKRPPMLRNLIRVYELAGMDYVPESYPGRLVLFRSQHKASQEAIARLIRRQHGWIGLAKDGLEIIDVPGDHHTMLQEPHVAVLVREISGWIARYAAEKAGAVNESAGDLNTMAAGRK